MPAHPTPFQPPLLVIVPFAVATGKNRSDFKEDSNCQAALNHQPLAEYEKDGRMMPHFSHSLPGGLLGPGPDLHPLIAPALPGAFRHSITSSAVDSNGGGIVRPRILAVWALITNSNLFDCTTGRSAGFAPMRMRPV